MCPTWTDRPRLLAYVRRTNIFSPVGSTGDRQNWQAHPLWTLHGLVPKDATLFRQFLFSKQVMSLAYTPTESILQCIFQHWNVVD